MKSLAAKVGKQYTELGALNCSTRVNYFLRLLKFNDIEGNSFPSEEVNTLQSL